MAVYIWGGASAVLFIIAVVLLARAASRYTESKAILGGLACCVSYALFWVFIKTCLDEEMISVKMGKYISIPSIAMLIYLAILNSIMKKNQKPQEKKKEM